MYHCRTSEIHPRYWTRRQTSERYVFEPCELEYRPLTTDTSIGLLHETLPGRSAFILDIIEPVHPFIGAKILFMLKYRARSSGFHHSRRRRLPTIPAIGAGCCGFGQIKLRVGGNLSPGVTVHLHKGEPITCTQPSTVSFQPAGI